MVVLLISTRKNNIDLWVCNKCSICWMTFSCKIKLEFSYLRKNLLLILEVCERIQHWLQKEAQIFFSSTFFWWIYIGIWSMQKKLSHKGLEKTIIPSRSFVQNFILDQICSIILYYTRIVVFNVQIINQKLKTNCSIHFTSNGNKHFLSIDWYGT